MNKPNRIVRMEIPQDIPMVHALVAAAFGRQEEADLVDELREHGEVTLSLIADEAGEICGHVLFSPVWLSGDQGRFAATGLGPLAVSPARQRQGIGTDLIRAGLDWLRARGVQAVFLEGDPNYYTRFGFEDAAAFQITCEFNPPPGSFLLIELVPGCLAGIHGVVHYAPEFQSVG